MAEQFLTTEQARQLAVLWARAEPIIRVYIASALGDSHLMEDTIQDIATVVTEKFCEFEQDRDFSRWVLGIARHRVSKTIRGKVRDRHVFSTEMIGELAGIVDEVRPEYDSRKGALKHCLAQLKGRSRRMIEMRYQWGKQVQSIAEELGMSRVAVSGVLLRCRKALARCIEHRLSDREGGQS